jgi:2,5-diamino-6-(ribosylamino)-4(3H)-pyrimidinone 5'-phosphate reductase
VTRPRIITYNIASLDGRLALSQLFAIGVGAGPDIRELHKPEAMLTGADSLWPLAAFPRPPARRSVDGDPSSLYVDDPPDTASGPPRLMAVTDSRGRLPEQAFAHLASPSGQYQGLKAIMLVARSTPAEYLAFLGESNFMYLVVGSDRVDLSEAVHRLGDLGIRTLVADAGGVLHGALLRAGLVDEVDVLFVPGLIGGSGGPVLFDGPALSALDPAVRLSPIAVESMQDGCIFARFEVGHSVFPTPWRPD